MSESLGKIGQSIFDEVVNRFPGRYVKVYAPFIEGGHYSQFVVQVDNHFVAFQPDKLDEAINKILERESYTNA